jgi:hypothetical protein
MLITISNENRNFTFEGKLSYITKIHNSYKIRTLAGSGYTFNNGTYRIISVNISYMNKTDIPVLENIILNGVLDIETEVGDNYYRVACVNESIDYIDENETLVSVQLQFENNILNNIKY